MRAVSPACRRTPVLTLQGAMPSDTAFNQTQCADMQGFGLHAAVRRAADER
jgi:hypothetical protein